MQIEGQFFLVLGKKKLDNKFRLNMQICLIIIYFYFIFYLTQHFLI